MAQNWKSSLKADPMAWLLEEDNPSVRYFTLRDLLAYPEGSSAVQGAKESIRRSPTVANIFRRQQAAGHWESADQPYHPKYRGTYWQIMIVSQLGLDNTDARVARACDYIFQFQQADGGFTAFREAGAAREYHWVEERAVQRGQAPPPFEPWAQKKMREYEMSCLTGNVAAALLRLGYADDDRVRRALNWLVAIQNEDGGWLCPYWKAHLRDTHGCFMGTITPLDAFAELPDTQKTHEMRVTVERGVEFLLRHHLFQADHHQFRVINDAWLKFGFPWFFYDVLRGLSVVTRLGYGGDERLDDALALLLYKQTAEGQWMLESTPSGRMHTSVGSKGRPSKWITLHALKVLKSVYQKRT